MKVCLPDNQFFYVDTCWENLYHEVEEDDEYKESEIGPLERNVLTKLDEGNKDLIAVFLNDRAYEAGIDTEEKLIELEKRCNSVKGRILYEMEPLTIEKIKKRFEYIWISHLFTESTGMSFDEIVKMRKIEKTNDPEELLYWSFRYCLWGGYDNYLPYTLYKAIVDKRFKKYYSTI